MPLNSAHEGYEYQDLLTAYFILNEILHGNESTFHIDKKLSSIDAFDDLTIERKGIILKKQIKYSNAHTLQKQDISADSGYQLAIDDLFKSWNNQRNDEIRLCLAWNEPTDELAEILLEDSGEKTFSNYPTKLFRINIDKLWNRNSEPLHNWKRLRKSAKEINRNEFVEFCNHLLIETNFPKFSLDIDSPGDLEKIVLDCAEKIGIGTFPNHHLSLKSFTSQLLLKIKKARSKGSSISSQSIFTWFKIKTDYGAIEQIFPIDLQRNIFTKSSVNKLFDQLQQCKKVMLIGEPGSGKSWLVNNFIEAAQRKKTHIIRHFCYTDLKDELQSERIKRDVFYGNLIADILKEFPNLKDKKEQLYASSLTELNLLLKNISKPTVLIIDGLDHIERVYDFYQYKDITKNEIQIFEDIKQIECSDNVCVLLASQPIKELSDMSEFQPFELPKWEEKEVKSLLKKYHIQNISINNTKLSTHLLEKSEGNPLYLTYLLRELNACNDITESIIRHLPAYSFNLKEYYDYLITKLNTKETLPRILSGVNFYLTKEELKEITGDGDYVDEAIVALAPILRLNISQNGYIIYHESFRRYILDVLHDKNVSIQQTIFNPTIEWFKSKDFFSYTKAYRYALKFYSDCRQYKEIEPFIQKDFIVNSVVWGQPWEQIEHNVYLLSRAAVCLKDLRHIIVVNELFKSIGSAGNSYDESFSQYLECIGLLKGFKQITNFLTFEGKPTVDLKQGLAACYLCSDYEYFAPWNMYFDYFERGKKMKLEDFKYYVRYFIVNEDTESIVEIANKVKRKKLSAYKSVLKEEIEKISNTNYKNQLIQENPLITEIITEKNSDIIKNIDDIIVKIKEIKGYEETANNVLNDFIVQCKLQIFDNTMCNHIVKQLSGKNWFYNWLIYCAKIAYAQNKPDFEFEDVHQAFSYLIYDLEPFKGEPRTCDLYYVQPFICKTLKDGLSLVKTTDEWKFAIDIIIQVSEGITTSFRGEIGGPIATDKLFMIFEEVSNPINNNYLISKSIELYEKKKEYHFFTYLSNYCFIISKLCYQANRLEEANSYFQLGARYMVSYTWRRDMTLTDGIECMASLARIDIDSSKKYLKQLKELADSVTSHTDGKDTKWLPTYWFEEYLKIDVAEATLWLMNQLYKTRYNWRLERNLKDLIEQTRGKVSPVIEEFIFNSFIVDNPESYLKCAIQINEQVSEVENKLALFFAKKIHSRLENKYYSPPSANSKQEVYSHLYSLGIEKENNIEIITSTTGKEEKDKPVDANNPNLLDMPLSELGKYICQEKLSDSDMSSLMPIVDKLTVNEESKQFIKNCVIGKYRWSGDANLEVLDKLFCNNQELRIYYNVLVFVWIVDGNGSCFSFIDKFKEAYLIDSQKTMEYFFELLPIIFTGINRDFSSNLLNTLTEVGFDNQILKDSFSNLVESIDYKIPIVDKYDWDSDLENEFGMNMEERLITILLIRSKAYTYDRLMNSLAGFAWLLYREPDKLIKPLKWIFKRHEYFLESVLLCFLDILVDYHKINPIYIFNFKAELENLYPTRYYLIDCILENWLNKPTYNILIQPQLQYSHNDTATLVSLNGRLQKIQAIGLDASSVVAKFKSTYQSKYKDKMNIYGNNSYGMNVQQIYPSDYILEIINHDLYGDLREIQKEEHDDLYEYLRINTKALIAQALSFTQRPSDLPLPSDREKGQNEIPIKSINGWIRLGHFENELKRGKNHSDLTEHRCSGTFSAGYMAINRLALDCLYNQDIFCSRYDGVLLEYNEHDLLENYHIIWLNHIMLNELQINTSHFLNGLVATNENDEIVLKCNQWCKEYVGNGDFGLLDEIPLIKGMELVIREDYFNKMMSILGLQCNQYTVLYF